MPTIFPDPRDAGPDGLVGIGGSLEVESLLNAYRAGIFPWPMDGYPLTWFCPEKRAVIILDDFKIPKSLKRFLNQKGLTYTHNKEFETVIKTCATIPRKGEAGTWITSEMIEGYIALHEKGYAHSVEVWKDKEIIGGVYGVEVDGTFSAESMFHHKTNASKAAIVHLVNHLKKRGLEWMDIQMMTPHMELMGAIEWDRADYLDRLDSLRDSARILFP